MRLEALTDADRDVVGKCLKGAVAGPFFPDWEFPTLFGLERAEVEHVRRLWPYVDPLSEDVELAVVNSLNNLLGYPHGYSLNDLIGHSPEEVEAALRRLAPDLRHGSPADPSA